MSTPDPSVSVSTNLSKPFTLLLGESDDPELALNLNAVLTQVLENVVFEFEDVRRRIEYSNRREVGSDTDVRNIQPDMTGVRLLSGVNELIEYDDLCNLINLMRAGVAARRKE